jgi:hypothetical protein
MVRNVIIFCCVIGVVYSDCEAPPHRALERVKYIPQSKEEVAASVNCTKKEHKPLYGINPWRNQTSAWCGCDKEIPGGYCLEVNEGNQVRFQENYKAPCFNFSATPCPKKYNASESYKYSDCFYKFGGVPSPLSLLENNLRLQGMIQRLEIRLIDSDRIIGEKNNSLKMLTTKLLEVQEKYNQKEVQLHALYAVFTLIFISTCIFFNRRELIDYCQQLFIGFKTQSHESNTYNSEGNITDSEQKHMFGTCESDDHETICKELNQEDIGSFEERERRNIPVEDENNLDEDDGLMNVVVHNE